MAFRDLLDNKWLVRIILVSWIISSFSVIYMISNLDMIVHGTLYNFGLQFSNEWANPYWIYLRLGYVFLGVSSGLGIFALILNVYKSKEVVVVNIPQIPQEKCEKQKTVKQKKIIAKKSSSKPKVESVDESNMIISCPNCKKVFGRPLVMLNFDGGKTRLVNVCPYCNHSLGQADNNGDSGTEFQIRGQDKAEHNQRTHIK